jgi:hypothetical protein
MNTDTLMKMITDLQFLSFDLGRLWASKEDGSSFCDVDLLQDLEEEYDEKSLEIDALVSSIQEYVDSANA